MLYLEIFNVVTKIIDVEYSPAKRDATLAERGLDMARAAEIFGGVTLTVEDDREDYGETHLITIGFLDSRMVVMVWTPHYQLEESQ